MEHRSPQQASERPGLDARVAELQGELLAFLRRRAPAEAEELAQEVWLRVTRAAPDCDDAERFRAYAFTAARRLLVDHHRRRAARITLVSIEGGLEAPGGSDPHREVAAGQTLAVVEAALAAMTPATAEVFRLRTTSDLSFKDIAARQGVPLNTALGRMHNATKKIRAALAAAGLGSEP